MRDLNVLGLCDGISVGQLALEQMGIPVKYYASETDKYCVKITDSNFSDTSQLGDITKWREWNLKDINLVMGGTPCQGFSYAGKGMNFEDPRSKLFFDFVNILKEYKPKYFLFENVKMKQEWIDIITEHLGVEPIFINSALVSAQNRQRLYWTNIPNVDVPDDRGVLLPDILEPDLKSCGLGARIVGRRLNELGKREDYNRDIPISQYLEVRHDGKSNCLSTVYKDSVVPFFKTDKRLKIKFNQKKASCLTGGAHSGGNHSDMDILIIDPDVCRRYSVTECERLQTLPDGFLQNKGISNSQMYKMLGNGWTLEVIKHILKNMEL